MAIMQASSIALSGINVANKVINMSAQNIANANTPGFRRLIENNQALEPMSGVTTSITNNSDPGLDLMLENANKTFAESNTKKEVFSELDSTFSGIMVVKSYDNFVSSIQQLAQDPNNAVSKKLFDVTAESLGNQYKVVNESLDNIEKNIKIKLDVSNIEIKNVQDRLAQLSAQGATSDQTEINALKIRLQQLSGNISGYNKALTDIIPPLRSAFNISMQKMFDKINNAANTIIFENNGRYTGNIGDIKTLSQMAITDFSQDIGSIQTTEGAKFNEESSRNNSIKFELDNLNKMAENIYGVDLVAEQVKTLQYKNQYEALVKVIDTENQMIGSLLNIVAR